MEVGKTGAWLGSAIGGIGEGSLVGALIGKNTGGPANILCTLPSSSGKSIGIGGVSSNP